MEIDLNNMTPRLGSRSITSSDDNNNEFGVIKPGMKAEIVIPWIGQGPL